MNLINLVNGWYCIGWDVGEDQPYMDQLVEIQDGEMFAEDGELIEGLYDPTLGMLVATNAADHYVLQAASVEIDPFARF